MVCVKCLESPLLVLWNIFICFPLLHVSVSLCVVMCLSVCQCVRVFVRLYLGLGLCHGDISHLSCLLAVWAGLCQNLSWVQVELLLHSEVVLHILQILVKSGKSGLNLSSQLYSAQSWQGWGFVFECTNRQFKISINHMLMQGSSWGQTCHKWRQNETQNGICACFDDIM